MRRVILKVVVAAAFFFASGGAALACHIGGEVTCVPAGSPIAGAVVTVTGGGETFSGTTNANGTYYIAAGYACTAAATNYDVSVTVSQGSVVESMPLALTLSPTKLEDLNINWTVKDVPGCGATALGCWLTGGGAKFSPEAGIYVAERGNKINFGGNVNPSCSPLPGDGGQWTHIDKGAKLFFQGQHIVVDDCGNISGIPPGSTSPVTPYNFIDFSGTGRLRSIAGNPNKVDIEGACFVARAEDRNEPGSTGMRDGAGKDRYYIRVFEGIGGDCSSPGATLLVLEANPGGTDRTDTVAITDGNLQLHITSCP